MFKNINKYIISIVVLLSMGIGYMNATAPSFDNNFAKFLTDKTPDQQGRVETVFSFSNCINRNQSIAENIKNLFYPNTLKPNCSIVDGTGGMLWDVLRVITFALIFLFIIIAGVKLLLNGTSGDEAKKAFSSLGFIAYGAFLVFGSIRVLGYVLNIENIKGTTDLVDNLQNNLFLQILSLLKVLAFFFAIVMMVVSGFKMMAAMDKEDKVKAGKQGAINVIIALVFIKIIDYVFYIAQTKEFAQKASNLILDIAKVLGWTMGILFVLALFYAGYQMFVSGGDEKAIKKSQSILVNIVLVSLVLFLFILLVYQIFGDLIVK